MCQLFSYCNYLSAIYLQSMIYCFSIEYTIFITADFFSAPTPPPAIEQERDPCAPNPCGPNSQCQTNGRHPACSCLSGYVGSPPNCRPECVINPDCPSTQACVNSKCIDPCPGSCGINAQCAVISHAVTCTCQAGYTGNPFVQCILQQRKFCLGLYFSSTVSLSPYFITNTGVL